MIYEISCAIMNTKKKGGLKDAGTAENHHRSDKHCSESTGRRSLSRCFPAALDFPGYFLDYPDGVCYNDNSKRTVKGGEQYAAR